MVNFYGNSGVCVFKYLVTKSDPQKEFTLSVLLTNLTCFLVIALSYLILFYKTQASSSGMTGNEQIQKRNRKLQIKVSLIILTDFLCWIPFITVCFLHFGEEIDATPWYPVFSIIILPINSVINPIFYNDMILRKISFLLNAVIRGIAQFFRNYFSTQQEAISDAANAGNPANEENIQEHQM